MAVMRPACDINALILGGIIPQPSTAVHLGSGSRCRGEETDRGVRHVGRQVNHRLTAQQSPDLYELIVTQYRVSSFVITSNRVVADWISLLDDPILGNSARDRLSNASYREKLSPHRKLLSDKGGDGPAKSHLVLLKLPRSRGGLVRRRW